VGFDAVHSLSLHCHDRGLDAAELGRQPWVIYGLMRTMNGASPRVSAGNGLFTLLGFMGMYMVLGILFLFLVAREVAHGPEALVSPLEPHPPESKQVLA
jgi:cytochrome bd ubiquinol oxidase subunit I